MEVLERERRNVKFHFQIFYDADRNFSNVHSNVHRSCFDSFERFRV